jgi:hypothetical protein
MPLTLNGTTGEVFPSWTTATRPASPTAGQTGFNTTTTQLETYDGTNWEIHPSPTTQGTSGQYLQSAGAGAAPTWATLSATGALIRTPQVLTSGTSYTTPSNCTAVYVEMVGGGGAGGIRNRADGAAGGGGGGGYCVFYATVTGSTAYTIAVGSGGAGSSTDGGGSSGGNTTFTVGATTYAANGGSVGSRSTTNPSAANGGSGGSASNGFINLTGLPGYAGNFGATGNYNSSTGIFNSTFTQALAGAGGSPGGRFVSGNAGAGASGSSAGNSGTAYGCGGGGCANNGSGFSSGSGYQGVIIVWEYT